VTQIFDVPEVEEVLKPSAAEKRQIRSTAPLDEVAGGFICNNGFCTYT